MALELRGEQPGDEEALDLVNFRAFGPGDSPAADRGREEMELVQQLRAHYPAYDPRYSVVAWQGEEAVGHALFTPAPIRLLGETVRALAVGPVAVLPEWQRKGIGGELLRYGHELGREEGYHLAFLCGHPSYYPRHGYRSCFGFAEVRVDTERLPAAQRRFVTAPVRNADLEWLAARCAAEWADVDFAWLWGPHRDEWMLPGVRALVWWTEEGERAAYTLATGTGEATRWRMVLGEDAALVRDVLATVRPASLAQHPAGWLARSVLEPEWASVEVRQSEAAMACELQPGALEPCLRALQSGERLPGACNYPLPFVLCGA